MFCVIWQFMVIAKYLAATAQLSPPRRGTPCSALFGSHRPPWQHFLVEYNSNRQGHFASRAYNGRQSLICISDLRGGMQRRIEVARESMLSGGNRCCAHAVVIAWLLCAVDIICCLGSEWNEPRSMAVRPDVEVVELLSNHCADCHGGAGAEADLDLEQLAA